MIYRLLYPILLSLFFVVSSTLWAQSEALKVVASTTIIADVAQRIGGDKVQVVALVPPDADTHAFQPTPQDVALVAEADILFVNGAGYETFLGALLENAGNVTPIVVSNGVEILPFGVHDHEHATQHEHEDEHSAVTAVYLSLGNLSGADDTLVSVASPIAEMAEIHQTTVENDIARMEHMDAGLPIAINQELLLEPGGLHIMLMGLRDSIAVGDSVEVTLNFASGKTLVISAVASEDGAVENRYEADGLIAQNVWVRPTDAMTAEEHNHDHEGEDAHIGILGRTAECDEVHTHEEEAHEHGACDPHVWTDPANVKIWADNIAAAYALADPANAAFYTKNAAAYKAELTALEAEIEALVNTIPSEARILVTNHEFLGYFAHRYGFEVVGVVIPGGTTLAEPNPQELAELVEVIRAEGVRAIFAEISDPSTLAAAIASEAGDVVIASLYSESLSAADGPAATYLDYMRTNAQTIVDALGQ